MAGLAVSVLAKRRFFCIFIASLTPRTGNVSSFGFQTINGLARVTPSLTGRLGKTIFEVEVVACDCVDIARPLMAGDQNDAS